MMLEIVELFTVWSSGRSVKIGALSSVPAGSPFQRLTWARLDRPAKKRRLTLAQAACQRPREGKKKWRWRYWDSELYLNIRKDSS